MTTETTLPDAIWPIMPTIENYTSEVSRIICLPITDDQKDMALSLLEQETMKEFKTSIVMRRIEKKLGNLCGHCWSPRLEKLDKRLERQCKREYKLLQEEADKMIRRAKASTQLKKKVMKLKRTYQRRRRKKLLDALFPQTN